ncbi:MAG TPA: hypothetical protein VHO27_09900, partial [Angustibacter sp.]|nr:hypothetical protein [Angustibacter sp.]
VVSFVMMGLLFALPLQAQAVHALDAQASGLRLLPLIGGLMVTAVPSGVLAARVGSRAVVAAGMAVLTAGLAWGATTAVTAGSWSGAGWTAVCGAGLGLALPTAMDGALGALPADAEGTGSAVLQALRMVGSSFGAAILGAVLNAGYRNGLPADAPALRGLPAEAVAAARDSVVGAASVAERIGSSELLTAARGAFVRGFDSSLWVAAALALVGAALALVVMTGRRAAPLADPADSAHEPEHAR